MVEPSPEKIQKDILTFQNYMQKKYGDRLGIGTLPATDAEVIGGDEEKKGTKTKDIEFNLKPEELESYLNQYVIKQGEAKAILATKVCTHFNRIKLGAQKEVGRIKNNIIMIGPTGVGKTYIIKLIADKIGVPFVKADSTKFSETGYVGGDVENLVRDLVDEADGDINRAQYGIIYLDEIDKLAAGYSSTGPDVSRSGVQRALLKLMEETEVDLKSPFDPAALMESAMQLRKTGKIKKEKINTKDILFIVSGAFSGLEEIVKKRQNESRIGFNVPSLKKKSAYLKEIKSEDLIEYGFESEFIARLPVVATFEELEVEDLYEILKNPNSPIILGKKRDFAAYGIEIEFENKALHKLAELSCQERTGARGLVSTIEKILLIYEKKLPSTEIKKVKITEATIENPGEELKKLLSLEPGLIATETIKRYQKDFYNQYGIRIGFTDEALKLLIANASKVKNGGYSLCKSLLGDYGLGLKLINRKTFRVTKEVLSNPKEYLNKLIKSSYRLKSVRKN